MKIERVRIVSDGTPQGTKVLMPDGRPIPNVRYVNWKIEVDGKGEAEIVLDCVAVEVLSGAEIEQAVDRTQRVLTDGSPVTPEHREIDPRTGMQKGYVVLTPAERAKGFVRPVRQWYTHKTCGTDTRMSLAIAETYARDPKFYSGTFCVHCRAHFDLDQFVWKGTDEQVGS